MTLFIDLKYWPERKFTFFYNLAPVCVSFCGLTASERGGGKGAGGQRCVYWAHGQRTAAGSPSQAYLVIYNQGPRWGRRARQTIWGRQGVRAAPSLVFVANPAPPPWPTSEKHVF